MINKRNGEIQDNEAWRFEDLYNYVKSDDFYNYAKDTKYGKEVRNIIGRYDFYGVYDYAEVLELETKPLTYSNPNIIHSNKFETVPDFSGSMVNMEAYLNGETEDMYNFVYSDSNIVKDINLYISLSWEVKASRIAAAAEKVYNYIINKPANVYFNVSITFNFRYAGSNKVKSLKIILSDSDSYMTDHCVNMLGSPVFFRWLILRYAITKKNGFPENMPTAKDYINFINFDLIDY